VSAALVSRGPLWAQPGDTEQQTLPLWRALLIALGMEIILPFLLLGVNWSALQFWQEPPPEPVMSVRLDQPQEEPPPPEPPVTRTRHAFSLMARRGLLRQMLVFFLLLALADAAIGALLPVLLRSSDVNPILMAALIATAPLVGAFSGAIVPREEIT